MLFYSPKLVFFLYNFDSVYAKTKNNTNKEMIIRNTLTLYNLKYINELN